jgi:hypothetical protein
MSDDEVTNLTLVFLGAKPASNFRIMLTRNDNDCDSSNFSNSYIGENGVVLS